MQAPDESLLAAGGSQVGKVSSVAPWCRLILSPAELLSFNFLHFCYNFSFFPWSPWLLTVLSLAYLISHSLTVSFFQSVAPKLHSNASQSWVLTHRQLGYGSSSSWARGKHVTSSWVQL